MRRPYASPNMRRRYVVHYLAALVIIVSLLCADQHVAAEHDGATTSAPPTRRCKTVSFTYTPSAAESETRNKSSTWMESYCEMYKQEAAFRRDLRRSVEELHERRSCVASDAPVSNALSYFTHTAVCGNRNRTVVTAIEPLYSSMRDPMAVVCSEEDKQPLIHGHGVDGVLAVDYLVTADGTMPAVRRAQQKIYIDLGASTWEGPSQSWIISHYAERQIVFDRILLWEADQTIPADKIFSQVPHEILHAFQYFHMPCTTDPDDPANPLTILKKIAKPSDYVVLKLDIDNSTLERWFVHRILDDPVVASLIDEFYWEPHYNFPYMVHCCWLDSANQSLSHEEVFDIFQQMRMRGIRSHGWP